jgi:hypothetical protein
MECAENRRIAAAKQQKSAPKKSLQNQQKMPTTRSGPTTDTKRMMSEGRSLSEFCANLRSPNIKA